MVSTIPARRQAVVNLQNQRKNTRKQFGKQRGSIRGQIRPLPEVVVNIPQGTKKKRSIVRLPNRATTRFGVRKRRGTISLG